MIQTVWELIRIGAMGAVVVASAIVTLVIIAVVLFFILWLIMLPFRKDDDL